LRATTTAPEWIRPSTYVVAGIGFAPVFAALLFVRLFKVPSSSMYPTLQIGDHVAIETLTPRWSPIERGEVIVHVYPCDPQRDYLKRVVAVAGDTVEIRCNVVYVNGVAIPNTLVDALHDYEDYDERDERWFHRPASMYHETQNGHAYDVFHDPERPVRDAKLTNGTLDEGDSRDFPSRSDGHLVPSCANTDDAGPHPPAQTLGKIVEVVPESSGTVCQQRMHYVVPPHSLFVLGDNRNNSNDSRVWGAVDESAVKGRVRMIWWARDRGRIGRGIE
jgi:signal peptidase I